MSTPIMLFVFVDGKVRVVEDGSQIFARFAIFWK
jgi:hypothetical protein